MPSIMVASSEQCRRHVSGNTSTIPSFSDDGVVQSVLKEVQKAGVAGQRTGTKAPLVSIPHLRSVYVRCGVPDRTLSGLTKCSHVARGVSMPVYSVEIDPFRL